MLEFFYSNNKEIMKSRFVAIDVETKVHNTLRILLSVSLLRRLLRLYTLLQIYVFPFTLFKPLRRSGLPAIHLNPNDFS